VLVKVHAVSLNASDWEMLRGSPLYARIGGPLRPRHRVLGSDIAGRVESTGRNATRFKPGDDVFARRRAWFRWPGAGWFPGADLPVPPAAGAARLPLCFTRAG
jgi:NADPH:quinone reductase-like Zn-dependent oxidoreductase